MRIYLPDINIQKTKIPENLGDTTIKISNMTQIYCLDGIYELFNNKISRLEIVDKPLKHVRLKDVNIIIDESVIRRHTNVINVEANNHICNVVKHEYSLRRNAKLILVIESIRSKIIQIYFETNEDIENFVIAEDFATLLSLLS